MADTIFTKILAGDIPCHKVFEDEHVFAFLDIGPLSRGHTLVIPKEPAETLDALSDDASAAIGRALPRICRAVKKVSGCDAIVVVAGLEGALPSVVGGYVDCPVIAVPTSVGYGASFGGVAALLGMLNSCASNVTVVNIDAGFKAGYVAGLISRRRHGNLK